MQMRWGAAVVCLLGCTRELALPNVTPLSASPAAATVAPREPLQINGSGGTPPYTFVLKQKQSGDRAALGAAGLYVAGDDGPAADIVRLSDSAGAKVDVAVAVGPSLTLSPASALVAPGGRVVFTATGGKRPYAFSVVEGPGTIGVEGAYVAASGGDTVSRVQVRDATPDAAAVVEVHVGSALSILPRTAALAPYATLDFVAVGGQPPYRYSVASTDGATVNRDTGHYQAGAGSGVSAVQDSVSVTDALQQTALASISTGPPLTVQVPSELHPFTAVRLAPTGGLPPYTFALANHGNRSRATLDSITGVYTPGSNFGANDVIEVRDATPGGRALVKLQLPSVGSLQLPATLARNCLAADMDGDGRQDAILYNPAAADTPSRIDVELMMQDGPPVIIRNNIPDVRSVAAADLNGDGRDDLVVQDTNTIRAYLSNSDGSLAPSILVATRNGTVFGAPVIVRGTGGAHSIYFRDTAADASACNGNTMVLTRVDWAAKANGPSGPATCVAPAVSNSTTPAFGDFNHDGIPDLAWSVNSGILEVFLGPDFFAATPIVLTMSGYGFASVPVVTDLDGDGIDDLVTVARRSSDGHIGLVAMKGSTVALTLGAFSDPVPDNTLAFFNLIAAPGHEILLWTRLDGSIYRVGADLALKMPQPPKQAFTVSCVALPDINADGAPDLLASGNGSNTAVVIPGDGDGTYGRRPHFFVGQNQAAIDVDGDGVDDLVYRSGPFTLQVLFGSNHQLALGPQTTMPTSFTWYVGPFYGSAPRDLLVTGNGDWSLSRAIGDGTWAPLEPIHDAQGPQRDLFPLASAELGGAAPGADLIGLEDDGVTLVPLLRADPAQPSLVIRLPAIPPPSPNCAPIFSGENAFDDYDGDGIADIFMECDDGNYIGRSSGSGASVSWSWTQLSGLTIFPNLFLGRPLKSGRVPFVILNGSNDALLGSLRWNGTSFDVKTAPAPEIPHQASVTGPLLKPVNLGDGGESLLVGRNVLLEYKPAADGTFTFVRSFSPGASWVPLSPAPGAPVDLLLSAKATAVQFKEATLFVNAGDGTFP